MPYDLSLKEDAPKSAQKKPVLGCAVAVWVVVALVFAAVGFFGYRVWTYYDQIRRGEVVELPQFQERFTAIGASAGASAPVSREVVEGGDHPSEGPDGDAALTIVQFADFECPYSKEEATVFRTLMTKYGDKVRFIYRDYPLTEIHPNATQSALAAECAREQGRFWAYHDKLYVNAPVLDYQSLLRYADEIGLEPRQFETCLVSERYAAKVEEDRLLAKSLAVRGTPTFFLNGQRVEGAVPAETFEQLIGRYLNN